MQEEDQQEEDRKYFQNLFFNGMHFGIPALIVSTYDDNPFLIKEVQPLRDDKYIDPDDEEEFKVSLPIISNVPFAGNMMFGGFLFTLPLAKGDKVWLTGCDISLDDLLELKLEGIKDIDIRETRRLDLSDMVAVGSFATKKDAISDFDKDNLVIRTLDNSVYLKIKKNGEFTMKGTKLMFGDEGASVALANAVKVNSRLGNIESFLNSHIHIDPLSGVTGIASVPYVESVGSTASTKVFTND